MRKKLIDSTKADIKKYMMIVESAGKVPASTREDFTLEDIENPYFQGDEDTEESEGNRYYVTVGVKIGFDENTDSYFPEVIWDKETGSEIEFDKLDKISKKSIQAKCDEIGSKIHVQRKDVNESTQIVVKALMQKFKISESKAKSIVAKVSESLVFETNDSEEQSVDVFVKHPVTKKSIEVSVLFMPTANGGYKIVEVSDAMTGRVYNLQSFDSSSVNKINTEIQAVLDDSVSESLVFENTIDKKTFETKLKGSISTILKKYGFEDTGRAGWVKEFGQRKTLGRIYLKSYQGTKKKYSIYPDQIETQEYYLESEHSPSKDVIGMYDLNEATPDYLETLCKKISDGMNRYYGVK